MTYRMLEALLIAGQYVLYAAGAFPLATIRIGGQLGDDLGRAYYGRKDRA